MMLAKLQNQFVYQVTLLYIYAASSGSKLGSIYKRSWLQKFIFHRHRSEMTQAPHLSYSQLVNETALYSNLYVHTKHILMDQKMTLVSTSCHCFHWCGFAVWLCKHLVHQHLLRLQFQCHRKMKLKKKKTQHNTLSHRNINISRLETNCPRDLPDASKQRNALNEARRGMCLKKCLMLDYMV